MKGHIDRLWEEYRRGGLSHVLRFLFSRAICRRVSRVVYDIDLRTPAQPVTFDEGDELSIYAGRDHAPIPDVLYRRVGGEENLGGLNDGDALFALKRGTVYVHTAFIFMKTRQTKMIGERDVVPLLGSDFTVSEARGQRLHPKVIQARLNWLRERKHARAVVETAVDNIASRRGIERSGFSLIRTMTGVILLNAICVQRITTADGKSNTRIWIA